MDFLDHYKEVWFCDFEYRAYHGERPDIHCMVASELRTGRRLRLWVDELGENPPFPVGPDSLFVAYYAPAELGCFLALGWPMPMRILDLCAEFKLMTNGLQVPSGRGLIGALIYHGLDSILAEEKAQWRDLAIRGGSFTPSQKAGLLAYCESDVIALPKLLAAMAPRIDLPRALIRGRYTAAVASMEHTGTPIDMESLSNFRSNWGRIKRDLIARVDANYRIYDGTVFKYAKFCDWLEYHDIPWPRLSTGRLDTREDTFREMSKMFPAVAPLHELRTTMAGLRLEELHVGADGRNRCMLSPFQSRTGRNQPSSSQFIFGPACWMRGLIKPEPGRAIAYVDWAQQEFAIAGALSGDKAMMAAYASGDPYLAFAKQAGAVPQDATKQSHAGEREQFKVCSLGVQYGMGQHSLGRKIGKTQAHGSELLKAHKKAYPKFWQWSQAATDQGMLHGHLWTVFGWNVFADSEVNPRSLANFPVQANGAEMLRLACCLATEQGINVCAPIHDAVLIEAEAEEISEVVAETAAAMAEAGRIVLDGYELRTDAEIVIWPDRYMDKRGVVLWNEIMSIASPTLKVSGKKLA